MQEYILQIDSNNSYNTGNIKSKSNSNRNNKYNIDYNFILSNVLFTATEVEEIEGELCNICYTFVIDRIFEPCKHTSCDQCISRHLLNDPCCFFCKEKVVNVREILPGDINSE
eukprot:Awhi_evm1s10850